MTAYIDNIIIQGTPEEIQEFIELRKAEERITFPDIEYVRIGGYHCMYCRELPCRCTTGISSNEKINWKFP